jgi:hypothetical protein
MRRTTPRRRLIEKGLRQYSAEYRSGEITGLSNHLPMCLYALEELGASAARIDRFYEWYVRRLDKRRVTGVERMRPSQWQTRLGEHAGNHEYFLLFTRELERRAIPDVLAEYLPVLFKGVGGGAFHPLIRLAYALEMDSRAEIGESLASWCMAYLELGVPEFKAHIGMRASAESLARALSSCGCIGSPVTDDSRRRWQASVPERTVSCCRGSPRSLCMHS